MDSPIATPVTGTSTNAGSDFMGLKITVDGQPYQKTYYDLIQARVLNERLTRNDDQDDLVLVAPESPLTVPMLLTMGMINLLRLDLNDSSKQAAGRLDVMAPVGLMEKDKMYPGVYLGKALNDWFGVMHKIKRNDGITQQIKLADEWRIQPLSVLDNFNESTSRRVYGQAIEDVMQIPRGSIFALQKSKILIITANREKIISDLKSVAIGGDAFEHIYTVARSDGFDMTFVGGNNLKVMPHILFSNDLATAADMVKSDPDIRLIFVAGYKAKDYANLDYINNDTVPRKIVCLLSPDQEEILQDLTDKGFDGLVWKRADFSPEQISIKTGSVKLNEHNSLIKELGDSVFVKQRVDWPQDMGLISERVISTIKEIEKTNPNYSDFTHWLYECWSLVNKLLQIPFGIRGFEEWLTASGRQKEGIKGTFATLAVRYESLKWVAVRGTEDKAAILLKDISDIISLLDDESGPKQRFADDYRQSHPESQVTVRTGIRLFDEYLMYRSFVEQSDGAATRSYKNRVLVLAPKKNKASFASGFLAPYNKVIYLGYDTEMKFFQWYFNCALTGPNGSVDSHLRSTLGIPAIHDPTFPKPVKNDDTEKAVSEEEVRAEEVVQEVIRIQVDEPKEKPAAIETSPNDSKIPAARIRLEGGLCLYLNEKHKVARLDASGTGYVMVRSDGLHTGDRLMFVAGNRDLFKDVLAVIKQSESYKALYEIGEAWRQALVDYATANELTALDISKKLRTLGCYRSAQNVRLWLDGDIICPEEDALEAIRLITKDERLLYGVKDIVDACTEIRHIHMNTGMEIVRRILSKAVNAETYESMDMGSDIEYQISLCASRARICTVMEISPVTDNISVKLEGKLQPDETTPR
jgi:hypothetical protein